LKYSSDTSLPTFSVSFRLDSFFPDDIDYSKFFVGFDGFDENAEDSGTNLISPSVFRDTLPVGAASGALAAAVGSSSATRAFSTAAGTLLIPPSMPTQQQLSKNRTGTRGNGGSLAEDGVHSLDSALGTGTGNKYHTSSRAGWDDVDAGDDDDDDDDDDDVEDEEGNRRTKRVRKRSDHFSAMDSAAPTEKQRVERRWGRESC